MHKTPCFITVDPKTNSTTAYVIEVIRKYRFLSKKQFQVVKIYTPFAKIENTINQVIVTVDTERAAVAIAYLNYKNQISSANC